MLPAEMVIQMKSNWLETFDQWPYKSEEWNLAQRNGKYLIIFQSK